ncbi:MAG: NADH:flavin oxidoreductase [Enterobacterales bacterium]|nr:NADH:flavin oxidoreductase [Enterobacterales bacterium]
MQLSQSRLFQPIELGPLKLRNRVVMAPMTRTFSPEGIPNDLVAAYYARRAKNEVGLIVTEGTCVGHKAANGYPNVPYIYGEKPLAGWKKVVDAVHAEGGKIVPQLWHVGAIRKADTAAGPDPSIPGYSPSGLVTEGKEAGVTMTHEDVLEAIEAFVKAAEDSKAIGFDGVEIHGAHGYLVDQFFWDKTNQREDEFGGDIAGRTRFAVEIIKGIKQRCGADFPVILRFSQWKQQNYNAKLAQNPEELKAFLQPLVDAGVDIFHCSTRRFWDAEFEGSDLNLAGWTKKLTGKPCITVGSVGLNSGFIDEEKRDMIEASAVAKDSFENLAERLEKEEFELVAIGRALLQDPEWVAKVREDRLDELSDYSKKSLMQLV